jgi:hypothetical protein
MPASFPHIHISRISKYTTSITGRGAIGIYDGDDGGQGVYAAELDVAKANDSTHFCYFFNFA